MGLWNGIVMRGITAAKKKEDIHKAEMQVEATRVAEKFGSYNHITLNCRQQNTLRWHAHHIKMKDERFTQYVRWRAGIITKKGDTGVETLQEMLRQLETKYGYFEGYTGETGVMTQRVPDKTKEMMAEFHQMLNKHNLMMMEA